ncbi:MAG: hypothetical protein ABL871_05805, partial [Terricaulis sp.]
AVVVKAHVIEHQRARIHKHRASQAGAATCTSAGSAACASTGAAACTSASASTTSTGAATASGGTARRRQHAGLASRARSELTLRNIAFARAAARTPLRANVCVKGGRRCVFRQISRLL